MLRKIIRATGKNEHLAGPQSMSALKSLIGADTIDTVSLRHMGQPLHVMLVDDDGHGKDLPINTEATSLYHAGCIPGTTHTIRGDVVVVPDSDFS